MEDESSQSSGRNTAGLRPWKPGQSGNPGGRPKRKPITDAYMRLLGEPIPGDKEGRTFADALAQKMIKEALNGKVQAASEITDRVEGRVPIQGSDGGGEDRLDELYGALKAGAMPRGSTHGDG